jgi:small subunit ribosomal protein S18
MFKKINRKLSSKNNIKAKKKKKIGLLPKKCRFCFDEELKKNIDYKNSSLLKGFLTDCGNIFSARVSGNCHSCQKKIAGAIRLSRTMALIQFCAQ